MKTTAALLLIVSCCLQSFASPYFFTDPITNRFNKEVPARPLEDSFRLGQKTPGKNNILFVPTPASTFGVTNQTTTEIFTDFGGFWGSTTAAPNAIMPDNSHHLLGFTYNGTTYSTGVNDGVLNTKGVIFTAGKFRALPVAGITGTNPAAGSGTYLALAKKYDGFLDKANIDAVAHLSIKDVLIDGINGLDLGTGVTNLPKSANLSFQIYNIDPAKTEDNEPDIILTQIADPSAGNDVFSFVDAAGNLVGKEIMQDMTKLSKFGTYRLDLFNLTPSTPYSSATAYSHFSSSDTRDIRVVAFKLSDFGITAANAGLVKALKITPSSTSDYAFIAYNFNAINLPPNLTKNDVGSQTTICSGGTANMKVDATPAGGGGLVYSWEESTNGGATWTSVQDGGNCAGATTNNLTVTNAVQGHQYRATVTESGNLGAPATSSSFTISVGNFTAPSSVFTTGAGNTLNIYANTATALTSTVTGGSSLYYQWQKEVAGVYHDIPGANLATYVPPVNITGANNYRLKVSSGGIGCPSRISTPVVVNVTCVAPKTPATICSGSTATLEATTSGGTVRWYRSDATLLGSGTKITVPNQTTAATYFVESSGCASSLRLPVKTTVNPSSVGGTVDGSTVVLSATNSTTLTLSGNVGNIERWESSVDNFSNAVAINNTTAELTVNDVVTETSYRAIVKSGVCNSVSSSVATIAVNIALPIHSASVKAVREKKGVTIQWTAYEQAQTTRFEIERSEDGVHFTKVHMMLPINIQDEAVNYSWLDMEPAQGTNYYRIKEVFQAGTYAYSLIVTAAFSKESGITVYPNPATGKNVQVQLNGLSSGLYQFRLFNDLGQAVVLSSLKYTGGYQVHSLQLPARATRGLYKLEITGPSGLREISNIMIL